MTSEPPPDVSERREVSQQEGTKKTVRHVRRKDEKLLFTTAIITHDHYSTVMIGTLRAVPEIILREGRIFFRPLHPQDIHGVRGPPPTLRTRKCFN